MTALTANTYRILKNKDGQTRISGTVLTSAVCYHHALLQLTAAGKVEAGSTSTTATFFGLCDIKNPTSATAGITGDGTLTVEAINNVDVVMVCVSTITVGNTGDAAFISDDNLIGIATLGPEVGFITEFLATNSVVVRLGAKGPLLKVKG